MSHKSMFFYQVQKTAYVTPDFVSYLGQFLDHLDNFKSAYTVMDNVWFYHADVHPLVEARGHHLEFLPQYLSFLIYIWKFIQSTQILCEANETSDKVHEAVPLE